MITLVGQQTEIDCAATCRMSHQRFLPSTPLYVCAVSEQQRRNWLSRRCKCCANISKYYDSYRWSLCPLWLLLFRPPQAVVRRRLWRSQYVSHDMNSGPDSLTPRIRTLVVSFRAVPSPQLGPLPVHDRGATWSSRPTSSPDNLT